MLGIEPTDAGKLAVGRGIPTKTAFFSRKVAEEVRREAGTAKLVSATNVFAHIEDVHDVVEGILCLLEPSGVFVSESHYLLSLIETLQYDTIYHEHLRYYSLRSLNNLLERHGLEVVDAKRITTHGGSIRVYAARRGTLEPHASVESLLRQEQRGLSADRIAEFRERVVLSKLRLHELLHDVKRQGSRVCGISAPSRASTLIHYCGLDDSGLLDYVVEVAGSHKIGKYMPGALIPVVEESLLFKDQPEYALLLSWHIADELIPKLASKGFRGSFIVPLPEPRIVCP